MRTTIEKKILVVDDEEEILRLLDRAFSSKGFEVLCSSSALDALVTLQDNPINLIVTDIKMPGMDGLDLIKQVRDVDPHIPIIVITGYGDSDTAISALDRGAFFFISKPFNITTILDAVYKGVRMPRLTDVTPNATQYATHKLEFEIPGDEDNLLKGINLQVAKAVDSMGFPSDFAYRKIPMIIDELVMTGLEMSENGEGSKNLTLHIEIKADKVTVEINGANSAFKKRKLPAAN